MTKNRRLKKRSFDLGYSAGLSTSMKEKAAIEKERQKESDTFAKLEEARQTAYTKKMDYLRGLISDAESTAEKIKADAKEDAANMRKEAREQLNKVIIPCSHGNKVLSSLKSELEEVRKIEIIAKVAEDELEGLESSIHRQSGDLVQ